MSSPYKPSAKQTLLPNSNINNLLTETHSIPSSFGLDGSNNYSQQYNNQTKPHLNRLPTLYEVLNRKTDSPVDLWSFYIFMRDYQNSVDYLDFWIDVITHLRLCKDYVKGLRESLLLSEKHKSSSDEKKRNTSSSNNGDGNGDDNGDGDVGYKSGNGEPFIHRSSVSSSLLLEALLNEGFLDDKDNKRVSSFLQGNEYINISDPRISAILGTSQEEEGQQEEEFNKMNENYLDQDDENDELIDEHPLKNSYEPLKSPSKIYDGYNKKRYSDYSFKSSSQQDHDLLKQDSINFRNSKRILPEQLEKYTENIKNGNISRITLKSSSKNILNTYFQENSMKKLNLPDRIIRKIKHDVELQGRDDPEVFDDAKNFVYLKMERESFPIFLQKNALHNLNNFSCLIRLIFGIFWLFSGFWISYCFIFINIKPKSIRAIIIIPFLIGIYLILTFLYKLDPILVFLGYCDSQELENGVFSKKKFKNNNNSQKWIKNLKEPFVKKLLQKRAIWVWFLILLITCILSVLFGLVPGHRL